MSEPTHRDEQQPGAQERPSSHAPKIVAVPSYNFGVRLPQKTQGLFDAEGRPIVASAREVVPARDNGLAFWQRAGERVAWFTAGGNRFWPVNCRHNVLQAYLIGRMKHNWIEDMLGSILWLGLLGAEAWLLYSWWQGWVSVLWLMRWIMLAVPVFLLSFIVVGLFTQLMAMLHLQRVASRVPYDELSITRIAPEELFYGLIIRPFATQHSYNLLLLLASCAGTCVAGWTIAVEMAEFGTQNYEELLVVFGMILGYYVIRWALFCLAINLAMAFAARARLFIMPAGKAYRRMLRDYLTAGFAYPIVLPVSFVAMVLVGRFLGPCILFVVAAPLLIYLWGMLISLTKVPTRVFRATSKYNRHWWVRSRVESEELPEVAKDIW